MGSQVLPWCGWRILVLFVVLRGFPSSALANTNEVLSRIVTVRVGGIRISGPWSTNTSGIMSLTLPKPARIEISYEPIYLASNQPIRLLRKMEGSDRKWEEAGGQMQRAEMQLMVLIHGTANQIISHRTFTMSGDSEGWRGEVAESEFRPRREAIVLPGGTRGLQVLLTAENWSVLGSAAITDFRLLHQDSTGREENIWPDPHFEEGENMDRADGTPRYWQRSGFGKRMAQITRLPPPAKGHALVIKDDDLRMSAVWQSDLLLGSRAHAGDTLVLKWREAFSVGNGGRSRATFEPMPPGEYVFRVKTVTPFGEPIGSELALTIRIPQPLWKRPLFVLPVILVSAVSIAVIVWFIVHRRMQARLNQSERRRQMEFERITDCARHPRRSWCQPDPDQSPQPGCAWKTRKQQPGLAGYGTPSHGRRPPDSET